jgi:flagellar biosynthesis chaperone FliJ
VRNFEKEMERSNTKLKAIEDILADQKTYDEMPADELNDLLAKAANLRKQVDKSEEGWLAASAELESIG